MTVYKPTGSGANSLNSSGSGGISLGTSSGRSALQVLQPAQGAAYVQPAQSASYYQPTSNPTNYNSFTGAPAPANKSTYDPAAAAAAAAAAAQQAAYDQAIGNTQAAINRLTGQQATGETNIQKAYQNAIDALLTGKNRASQDYTTNKNTTTGSYVAGKNTVGSNAGASLNGLRRLLGSRGAGGSSAYNIAAPEAVAREATLQRNNLSDTYGTNMQGLDTAWGRYQEDYTNSEKDVAGQRDTQLATLRDQVASNKASLLQKIAELTTSKTNNPAAAQSYLNQANALLDTVGVTANPTMNYKVGSYVAPEMGAYTSSITTPTVQGQGPANDYVSPYYQTLVNGKKKTNTGVL